MPAEPRISIVTPSYNQGRWIRDTIESVLAQDYPDIEHIVMDGGSTDETVSILESYPHLRWVSEPDEGQTSAINKGLAIANGEIVAYLNSDDVYRPGAFRAAADAFDRHPDCDAVAGNCDVIDAEGRVIGLLRSQLDGPADLLRFWSKDVCIPQPAVFLRRRAVELAGGFDESFDMAMDLEMWLRLARRGTIRLLPRTLAAFRITGETKTSRRKFDMLMETHRAVRKHLDLAPLGKRWTLNLELRRETAGHLLTLAEAEATADSARRVTVEAIRFWPLILHSARVWRLLFAGR